MTQEDIRSESQNSPVVRCSGKCGNYHELNYMTLHVPSTDAYYCYHCVRTTTYLREVLEELEGKSYEGHRDIFTDPEWHYAQRRRMTDKENKHLNDSWIRSHWRLNK